MCQGSRKSDAARLFREALSIVENGIAEPKDVDDANKYGFGMRLGISAPMGSHGYGGIGFNLFHS